jgi:hypothetical protein
MHTSKAMLYRQRITNDRQELVGNLVIMEDEEPVDVLSNSAAHAIDFAHRSYCLLLCKTPHSYKLSPIVNCVPTLSFRNGTNFRPEIRKEGRIDGRHLSLDFTTQHTYEERFTLERICGFEKRQYVREDAVRMYTTTIDMGSANHVELKHLGTGRTGRCDISFRIAASIRPAPGSI